MKAQLPVLTSPFRRGAEIAQPQCGTSISQFLGVVNDGEHTTLASCFRIFIISCGDKSRYVEQVSGSLVGLLVMLARLMIGYVKFVLWSTKLT